MAIIAAMAFLLVLTIASPFLGFPVIWQIIVNVVIITIILRMVLQLQNTHNRDIHALNARLDEFIAEMRNHTSRADAEELSETELQQVRELLKRQKQDDDDDIPAKSNRDRRPSLF